MTWSRNLIIHTNPHMLRKCPVVDNGANKGEIILWKKNHTAASPRITLNYGQIIREYQRPLEYDKDFGIQETVASSTASKEASRRGIARRIHSFNYWVASKHTFIEGAVVCWDMFIWYMSTWWKDITSSSNAANEGEIPLSKNNQKVAPGSKTTPFSGGPKNLKPAGIFPAIDCALNPGGWGRSCVPSQHNHHPNSKDQKMTCFNLGKEYILHWIKKILQIKNKHHNSVQSSLNIHTS